MSRFYVEAASVSENSITVSGTDVNHIRNVLRKKPGDKMTCFDPSGMEYSARIKEYGKDTVVLEIVSRIKLATESPVKVSLIQSLPKLSKMDDIVKNSSELGVFEIFPVITERSIPKADKTERWQRIAKEAAEQSGRGHVPVVHNVSSFDRILETAGPCGLKLIPWEGERTVSLKESLKISGTSGSIAVLIGPEGGFSSGEVEKAAKRGFIPVSLGKRILRTETAGPAVLAMIMYEREL